MHLVSQSKIGARFKLITHKGDGIPTGETDWFNNLVLDSGLARMSVDTWIDRCCVGAGNSTPLFTQTSLDNFISSTTSRLNVSSSSSAVSPYYSAVKITWRFGEGVAAGNISEVGLGWGNNNLWNRALIKDLNGNPTTITVLSDEFLDVVSEIRLYPGDSISGSFNLLNKTGIVISTHELIGKPAYINSALSTPSFSKVRFNSAVMKVYSGEIGPVSGEPSGTGVNMSISETTYSGLSMQCEATLGLTSANFKHKSFLVSAFIFNSSGNANYYQFEITPPIEKLSTQIIKYTFSMSWGRYESP